MNCLLASTLTAYPAHLGGKRREDLEVGHVHKREGEGVQLLHAVRVPSSDGQLALLERRV